MWAFVISCGAGGVLLVALLLRGTVSRLTAHRLRYFVITAAVSYALPNLLMFSAMPHLGAGYTGIMFTLSPVITLVLSMLLGVRRPNLLGIAGIVVGFVGAVMVAVTRGEAGQPADMFWVVVGLLIPVSLAAGNIYRTVDWPEGNRTDRACRRQPSRGGGHSARRARGRWRARLFAQLAGVPLLVARAGRLGIGDVRVLLPAAGGRRAGLSQPDRLCRGGCRADRRHAVSRRALPAADLAGRGDHHRRRVHDHEGAKPERLSRSGRLSALPCGRRNGRSTPAWPASSSILREAVRMRAASTTAHSSRLAWCLINASGAIPRTMSSQNRSTWSTTSPCVTAAIGISPKPASRISAAKTARSSGPDNRAVSGAVAPSGRKAAPPVRQRRLRGRRPARDQHLSARAEHTKELGKTLAAVREKHQPEHRDAKVETAVGKRQRLTVALDDLDIGRFRGSDVAAKLAKHGAEKSREVTRRTAGAISSDVVPGPQATSSARFRRRSEHREPDRENPAT